MFISPHHFVECMATAATSHGPQHFVVNLGEAAGLQLLMAHPRWCQDVFADTKVKLLLISEVTSVCSALRISSQHNITL